MAAHRKFVLKVSGDRKGKPLSLEHLILEDLQKLLDIQRNLIYTGAEPSLGRETPIAIESGSIMLTAMLPVATAMQLEGAIMGASDEAYPLATFYRSQQSALRDLDKFVKKHRLQAFVGSPDKDIWIEFNQHKVLPQVVDRTTLVELEVKGEVTDIGGQKKPNIHLSTQHFGNIKVASDRQLLAELEKNYLYKSVTLRIEVPYNLDTDEYEFGAARLVDFVEYKRADESATDYLDRLIATATDDWKDIEDTEQWLHQLRGYED